MSAIDSLDLDLAFWSDQNSFFDAKPQKSAPNVNDVGQEWDIQEIDELWKSIESDFQNGEDLLMAKKSSPQSPEMTNICTDIDSLYLNASTFLSPVSLAPSSPRDLLEEVFGDGQMQPVASGDDTEDLDLETTSAMEFLNTILASNASIASEYPTVLEATSSEPEAIEEAVPLSPAGETAAGRSRRQKRRYSEESDDPEWDPKPKAPKRGKRAAVSVETKKERKKDQNKTAANRYRIKKRAEQQAIESLQDNEEVLNKQLKQQLDKLQMEFRVVFPLAKAAFTNDPNRLLQLQLIQEKVAKEHLLA